MKYSKLATLERKVEQLERKLKRAAKDTVRLSFLDEWGCGILDGNLGPPHYDFRSAIDKAMKQANPLTDKKRAPTDRRGLRR